LEVPSGEYLSWVREDARKKIAVYYVLGFILIILYAMTLFWFGTRGDRRTLIGFGLN
jgi:hypothetical protein